MANLIAWHEAVIDPGFSGNQDPTQSIQRWVSVAEFDEPPTIDEVYACRQCPTFFDPLVVNGRVHPFLFLVNREVTQIADVPQAVKIAFTFSNKWENQQNEDKPDVKFEFIQNPILRPALINWGRYSAKEAVEIDEDGVPVTTTVGEPLILEESKHYRALTIQKNVARVTEIFAEGEDYINEDEVIIGGHKFKKKTLWLMPIEIGHISVENKIKYYPITLTLLHHPLTWIRRVRNAGYHMRSLNGKWVERQNGTKEYIFPVEPILLGTNKVKTDRPILLDEKGIPIQLKITGKVKNPDWYPGNTYNIPKTKKEYIIDSPEDFVRAFTKEELAKSIRYFRTKKYLNFKRELGGVLK